MTNGGQIVLFVWCVNPMLVAIGKRHRGRIEKFLLLSGTVYPPPSAPPLPIFTLAYTFRSNWIPFNIFEKRKEIPIGTDEKRFIPSLIEVAISNCLRTRMYLPSVCIGQPVHKETQVTIILGMENKVPMVRHDH